jgi:hypothetical protein
MVRPFRQHLAAPRPPWSIVAMTSSLSRHAALGAVLLSLAAAPVLAAGQAAAPVAAPAPVATASKAEAAPAARSTLGDQARFLAGLPVPATSPLAALANRAEWKAHEAAMARSWPMLANRLDRAAAFQAASLSPLVRSDRNVIYFFGGPDAAHAVKLFPDAPAYLLAGLEPVGAVEAPEAMKAEEVDSAVHQLAVTLKTIIEKSFFRTSDMGRDLRGKGIRGVEPVLFVFLARTGAEVLDATNFEVDAAGQSHDKAAGEKFGRGVPGIRIRFQFPGRPIQEMSYVSVDVLDEKLGKDSGFLAWASRFGPANGFLKAASFILHDNAFSRTRSFLMASCESILQDDSGVPYHFYKKAGEWTLTCFGPYQRPRDPFQGHMQSDLSEACKAQPARPLDFIIGYRRLDDSALQLYVKGPPPPQASAPAVPGTQALPPLQPVPSH